VSTAVKTQAKRARRTDATAWCYVSGRVNALEKSLLPRNFFTALLECGSAAEARAALGKTAYRTAFAGDEAVVEYAATIQAYGAAAREELFGQCPPHAIKRAWGLAGRYRAARVQFLRRAGEGAAAELAEILETIADGARGRQALAAHRDLVAALGKSGDGVATSLVLDSAACTVMLDIARSAPEAAVRGLLSDRAVLAAWSSVLRSRWNGTPAEVINRWFVFGGGPEGLVRDTAEAAEAEPAAALAGRVSRGVKERLEAAGREALRSDLDAAVSRAIREKVLVCRRPAFGPERLLAYLWALEVEERNLRIALAAVVENLDRGAAAAKLGGEYA
jgi:hypothetical protein